MSDRQDGSSEVDLTLEERADIDGMYLRLANSTHYELLGVPPDADRRTLRDAYFLLSQRFHPDAWFGRKLGAWQVRMDAIFREVTDAYDTLQNRERRARYDAELARRRPASRHPGAPSSPPASLRGPSLRPPAPAPLTPVLPTAAEARASAREALARKLGRRTASSERPAAVAGSTPLESLRHVMQQRGESERQQRLDTLKRTADDAMLKSDLAGAANALSLAMQFAPGDADLARKSTELDARVVEARTSRSIAEAEDFERSGEWEKAANAWERAAGTRPDDHTLFDKAALALLRAGKDLPRAAELARRATVVSPRNVETYAILAQVFIAGGLRASALSALDTASKLDPTSVLVKDLIVKIKG